MLCLSGGVPLTLPIVAEAVKRGIPLSNDSQIFMEVVPCKTIGITGSAGKTTTTTLVGKMAKPMPMAINAYIGGNIGDPLINYVDKMEAEGSRHPGDLLLPTGADDDLAEYRCDPEYHAQPPGPSRHDGSLHRCQGAHPGFPKQRRMLRSLAAMTKAPGSLRNKVQREAVHLQSA